MNVRFPTKYMTAVDFSINVNESVIAMMFEFQKIKKTLQCIGVEAQQQRRLRAKQFSNSNYFSTLLYHHVFIQNSTKNFSNTIQCKTNLEYWQHSQLQLNYVQRV